MYKTKFCLLIKFAIRHRFRNHIAASLFFIFHPYYLLKIVKKILDKTASMIVTRDNGDQSMKTTTDRSISTSSFVIRSFSLTDLNQVLELDPPTQTTSWNAFISKKSFIHTQWWNEFQTVGIILRSQMVWVIQAQDNHRIIGYFSLMPITINEKLEMEMGYVVHHRERGKGVATLCRQTLLDLVFNVLELKRIISLIEPSNIGSMKIAEKDMELEGQTYLGDKIVNIYALSVENYNRAHDHQVGKYQ